MKFLLLLPIIFNIINISTAWHTFLEAQSKYDNLEEPILPKTYVLPEVQWFTQYLDHFNPTDARVWKQRYFVNSNFYKPNGPIFLMIGTDSVTDPNLMVKTQWIEYAKEFGAMCFYLEHRYYGKSHPTPDLSVKNLLYLNSQQTLADLAYFIQNITTEYKFSYDIKWIAFGGSYGGSLAAWMRVKYPHLVHGAVSSSAPLLMQFDFQEFYAVVANVLKDYSQKCVDIIAEADRDLNILLHDIAGQQQIEKKFKLCDPIDSWHIKEKKQDISILNVILAEEFIRFVLYNKNANCQSFPIINQISTICNALVNILSGKPIDRLAYVSNLILNANKEKCLNYKYDKIVRILRDVSWESKPANVGERQWMYQICTEFGFFQTSTAPPNLFSNTFPIDFFIQFCADIFGITYDKDLLKSAVDRTNILYGALNLQVTNVVFVHGSEDPLHVLSITTSSNPQVHSIYINGTGHCADMYPSSEKDIPQLKKARIQIKNLIKQWLQNSCDIHTCDTHIPPT